jgi:hypothetical protein
MNISSQEKARVIEAVKNGNIDAADVSYPNLVDEIILRMKKVGMIARLANVIPDKRQRNRSIPFEILLTLFIAAKMKIKTSLTDVPFAITDAATLSEIGWNIWDNDRKLDDGLLSEGGLRYIVKKYPAEEMIQTHNRYVQEQVMPGMDISPNLHILDCSKLRVNLDNPNYEKSEIVKDDEGPSRGYKLATLRGIVGDAGIIEEIAFGDIKVHDLRLSEDMVKNSTVLKPGDVLINDRGFISRPLLNCLKSHKGVDTYIPLRENMTAFEQAVLIANQSGHWAKHPNKKRKHQEIAFVELLGTFWLSDHPEDDVEFNACVVRENKNKTKADPPAYEYRVFITTDLSVTAKQIIQTYELRPEIEEEYRQIKDFWNIEDFKTTKYDLIVFHIIMVLIGYLFFQLYRLMPEGHQYIGKSLPISVKNYIPNGPKTVICYVGRHFGIFGFLEFLELYAALDIQIQIKLKPILAKV